MYSVHCTQSYIFHKSYLLTKGALTYLTCAMNVQPFFFAILCIKEKICIHLTNWGKVCIFLLFFIPQPVIWPFGVKQKNIHPCTCGTPPTAEMKRSSAFSSSPMLSSDAPSRNCRAYGCQSHHVDNILKGKMRQISNRGIEETQTFCSHLT